MKFILIVFASFHFDAGVDSQQVEFETMQKCQIARKELIEEHMSEQANWGRRRITAICVAR